MRARNAFSPAGILTRLTSSKMVTRQKAGTSCTKSKKGAEAGVILGKQHVGNFQQRYFAADAAHFHIDKRKQVGQQQHKQRDQRVSRGTLARRVPRGG